MVLAVQLYNLTLTIPINKVCRVCRKVCWDTFGEYIIHCRELADFKYWHYFVMGVLFYLFWMVGEFFDFLTGPHEEKSTLRILDVSVYTWIGRKHVCVYLTGVFSLLGLRIVGLTMV